MPRQYHNKDWLIRKYQDEQWSQLEIAEFCDVSQSTIYAWMKRFDIPSRDMSESHLGSRNGAWIDSAVKDYHYMYREYVLNRKTLREIAAENKIGLRTVARWLKSHGIESRSGSEAIITSRDGYNNPNYKGIGDITNGIRSYTKSDWAPKIIDRDNNRCVECGEENDLHAHHIVPFYTIRDQILFENSHLDLATIEGRLEVIRIAKLDPRMNDLDNGITLCVDCHIGEHRRKKVHTDNLTYIYNATVLEVLDPDTIRAEIDLGMNLFHTMDVRLFGINAPETVSTDPNQATALRGKEIIKEICRPGRKIILRTYKPGKYGRWLAFLILDANYINHSLVKAGLADERYY